MGFISPSRNPLHLEDVKYDFSTSSNHLEHMGVSKNSGTQNGWFIMENPIKMDDLGVPLFLETSIFLLKMIKITSWSIPVWLNMWSFFLQDSSIVFTYIDPIR